MKIKNIFIALGVILVILLLFLVLRGSKKKDMEFITKKIEKGNIQDIITATGTVKALNTVDVGTQVSGVIDELFVDFNDHVSKGQIIARLDTKTLSANVSDAKSNLEKAQLQTEQLKLIFERTKKLFEQNLASREDYERTEFEFKNSDINVKMMKVQLDRASVNLGYATITSPIDGVIIGRTVTKGQTVAAAFTTPTLFTIAQDLKNMLIEADIDEADIGRIKNGQDVEFFVDAFPDETFKGKVKQVRLQPKSVQNVVNYTVIIEVKNEEMKIFPGMTANLSIIVDNKNNVLTIPASSLNYVLPDELPENVEIYDTTNFDENEISRRSKVWIMDNHKVRAVIVETGINDGSTYELLNGLKPKDVVITSVEEIKPNVKKDKNRKKSVFKGDKMSKGQ